MSSTTTKDSSNDKPAMSYRTVATSLTDGVPMNAQLECGSRTEAVSTYLTSLRAGHVRRMRARTLESGEM